MANTTYQDLQNRIAGELLRTDLTSQIQTAIARAIEKYAERRFWFNEEVVAGVCTPGGQYVTYPTGLRIEDAVFIDYNASGPPGYPLLKKSAATIEGYYQAVATQTQPSLYCTLNGQIRLYPTPNLAYPLSFVGVFDQPALANPTDSNAWTTTGQDLIVAEAKRMIDRDILRDIEAAQLDGQAVKEALDKLIGETTRRTASGRIKPSL
jgi:hypothetical protein